MKLYSKYTSAIEQLGKIKKAYFTTFNLSPEFFETYILPPLLGEEIPDNSFQYEPLNSKLEELNIDIKVFFDANMMQINEQKRTVLKFYPVLMTNENDTIIGLFHPKVIYLENEKGKGKLFVGSGNLTLNGWGRNIEAFDIVDVEKPSKLYNQIYNFLLDVELKAGFYKDENKKYKGTQIDENLNFIYSYKKNVENSILLENLNAHESSNLYVWSPYFSENIDEIVDKEFNSIQKVNIIPDLVGANEKIRLKNTPKSEKIKFYSLDKSDTLNMNHSKVWATDIKIAIGSYNFTNEALYGTNFEAALIRNINEVNLNLEEIIPNCMIESELKNEKLESNTNFNVVFELIANWENRRLTLKQIAGKEINNCKLMLPANISLKYSSGTVENLEMVDAEKFFRALIKNKYFKITKDDEVIYEGIVTEESTKGFREPLKVETINDIFISFLDENDPIFAKKIKNRTIDFDVNDSNVSIKKLDNSYLNYYNLFRGFYNMHNKLDFINNEVDLKLYCFNASNSISSIALIIEEYKKSNQNLFTYLFVKEFNMLVKHVNKKIKKLSCRSINRFEEINNINLKLSDVDTKFLGMFYGN